MKPFPVKYAEAREILKETISCIPPKTKVYVVGGAARSAAYFDLLKKSLPQRDLDILLVGDLGKFVENLRRHRFTYGKIRRKNDIVLKKKIIPSPVSLDDYVYLDIHKSVERNIKKNLQNSAAFTISGFAIPLKNYCSEYRMKHLVSLPGAVGDLKKKRLRLNGNSYKKHPGNLFACLRFMSLGFTPPGKKEVSLLLEQLKKMEKWRFERNVKKVFSYVGGERKARRLVKRLGIKTDIFDIDRLRRAGSA